MTITNEIKTFAKKSDTILSLYRSMNFFTSAPMKDFFDAEKSRIIRAARPYTMLTWRELSALYDAAATIERENIPGAIAEFGVCNGGSTGVMSAVVEASNREIWMFDSWEGLPEPTSEDVTCLGEKGEKGICLGSQERVQDLLFNKLGLARARKHFVKGWFDATVPARGSQIGQIALLHLDGDWYDSIKICLDHLYDQVADGGFIVLDDYGYWEGAKKATHDFLDSRGIQVEIVMIDDTGAYFRKPATARA